MNNDFNSTGLAHSCGVYGDTWTVGSYSRKIIAIPDPVVDPLAISRRAIALMTPPPTPAPPPNTTPRPTSTPPPGTTTPPPVEESGISIVMIAGIGGGVALVVVVVLVAGFSTGWCRPKAGGLQQQYSAPLVPANQTPDASQLPQKTVTQPGGQNLPPATVVPAFSQMPRPGSAGGAQPIWSGAYLQSRPAALQRTLQVP